MLVGGVNGALLTGDLFNLFVFIEVMLLPSYALLAITGTWRRLGVGRLFVLINLLTSTILLIGSASCTGWSGTVTMAELVGVAQEDPRAALAVGVVLFALSIKAGVVPLHGWLPRSYPATSSGIMARSRASTPRSPSTRCTASTRSPRTGRRRRGSRSSPRRRGDHPPGRRRQLRRVPDPGRAGLPDGQRGRAHPARPGKLHRARARRRDLLHGASHHHHGGAAAHRGRHRGRPTAPAGSTDSRA